MKREDEDDIITPPAANSNGSPNGGSPIGGLDPRLRIIARASGHQIAREQGAAWEGGKPAAGGQRQPARGRGTAGWVRLDFKRRSAP